MRQRTQTAVRTIAIHAHLQSTYTHEGKHSSSYSQVRSHCKYVCPPVRTYLLMYVVCCAVRVSCRSACVRSSQFRLSLAMHRSASQKSRHATQAPFQHTLTHAHTNIHVHVHTQQQARMTPSCPENRCMSQAGRQAGRQTGRQVGRGSA